MQGSNQNRPFKSKIYQGRKDKVEIIIMVEAGNGIGLDQVAVIGIEDQIIEIDLSMDTTMQKGLNMVRIIMEETLGEETIEDHKIIEDQPLEGNIEEMMGIVILIGVETGLEIDNFQVILGGMIEVALCQDQVVE